MWLKRNKSNQKQDVWSMIQHALCCKTFQVNYFGGESIASRNSSILLTSVLTSPLKVMNGGCVPGARLWRSAGFLSRTQEKADIVRNNGNARGAILCSQTCVSCTLTSSGQQSWRWTPLLWAKGSWRDAGRRDSCQRFLHRCLPTHKHKMTQSQSDLRFMTLSVNRTSIQSNYPLIHSPNCSHSLPAADEWNKRKTVTAAEILIQKNDQSSTFNIRTEI